MAESFFSDMQAQAFRSGVPPQTKDAQKWFQNKVQNMAVPSRNQILKDPSLKKARKFSPGDMYMYFYDPKMKKELPYYDAFPLTIVVDAAPGGFYGLNMHYLHPTLRAKLFDALLETTNKKGLTEDTKFQLTYEMLKGTAKMKHFQPCFKHYLAKHVQSGFARVEAPEWPIAMFMPLQQFQKASATKVWAESRRSV